MLRDMTGGRVLNVVALERMSGMDPDALMGRRERDSIIWIRISIANASQERHVWEVLTSKASAHWPASTLALTSLMRSSTPQASRFAGRILR